MAWGQSFTLSEPLFFSSFKYESWIKRTFQTLSTLITNDSQGSTPVPSPTTFTPLLPVLKSYIRDHPFSSKKKKKRSFAFQLFMVMRGLGSDLGQEDAQKVEWGGLEGSFILLAIAPPPPPLRLSFHLTQILTDFPLPGLEKCSLILI